LSAKVAEYICASVERHSPVQLFNYLQNKSGKMMKPSLHGPIAFQTKVFNYRHDIQFSQNNHNGLFLNDFKTTTEPSKWLIL
jgi:hypothetical protein